MAKVRIKSDKITPFGGMSQSMGHFETLFRVARNEMSFGVLTHVSGKTGRMRFAPTATTEINKMFLPFQGVGVCTVGKMGMCIAWFVEVLKMIILEAVQLQIRPNG